MEKLGTWYAIWTSADPKNAHDQLCHFVGAIQHWQLFDRVINLAFVKGFIIIKSLLVYQMFYNMDNRLSNFGSTL